MTWGAPPSGKEVVLGFLLKLPVIATLSPYQKSDERGSKISDFVIF